MYFTVRRLRTSSGNRLRRTWTLGRDADVLERAPCGAMQHLGSSFWINTNAVQRSRTIVDQGRRRQRTTRRSRSKRIFAGPSRRKPAPSSAAGALCCHPPLRPGAVRSPRYRIAFSLAARSSSGISDSSSGSRSMRTETRIPSPEATRLRSTKHKVRQAASSARARSTCIRICQTRSPGCQVGRKRQPGNRGGGTKVQQTREVLSASVAMKFHVGEPLDCPVWGRTL